MSVDGQVEGSYETVMPNNNSAWESDFESFNFKVSSAVTCFVSEKIKYILDIDRQIHMNLLIKSLRKDIEDAAPPLHIVLSNETNAIVSSRSPFSKASSKFRGEKSSSE